MFKIALKRKIERVLKMRNLNDMINEACIKSKKMRNVAWKMDYASSQIMREKQTDVYKKWLFLKNVKKAIEKTEKEG